MAKVFEYSIEELNAAVYQVQKAEAQYQKAKDDYEILYDSSKDLLAQLKTQNDATSDTAAETKARASSEWRDYKAGLYAAQRKLGEASLGYNHAKRVLDVLTSGLAFKRELLKRGIIDQ